MNNKDYWYKRYAAVQKDLLSSADKYCGKLESVYISAIKDIEKQTAVWFQRFADNNNVSIAEAKRMLTAKELDELKWDVEQYIKAGEENGITKDWSKELENASARFHISRLDAVKLQIQQKIEELYGNREADVKKLLGDIYSEGCYKNAYEIMKATGAAFEFAKIDDVKLEKILSKPWTVDGRTFSQRIWSNRKKLVSALHNELVRGIAIGSSSTDIAKRIKKEMNTDLRNAQRLVVTESAYFATEAQRDTYKSLNVGQYQILGTLDLTTCDSCGDMDGKVFSCSDMRAGVTAPPFHPNCRCTTVPYIDDELLAEGEQRAARDEDGKTVYVEDMSYKEWKERFVDKTDKRVVSADDTTNSVQNYKPVILAEENKNIQRRGSSITTHKVTSATNNIFVSDNVKLKRKQLQNIDSNVSKVKELLGITDSGNMPVIYIINDGEMGTNALASYNPVKNVMFFNEKIGIKEEMLKLQEQFAAKDNEMSTFLHEFMHWQDCMEYIKRYGVIVSEDDYNKYLKILNKKAKKTLDKLEKTGYNVNEISTYASFKLLQNDMNEVYTEYRVRKMLER